MKLESRLIFRTMSRVPQLWKFSSGYFFLFVLLLAATACRAPGGKVTGVTPLNEPAPVRLADKPMPAPPAPTETAKPQLPAMASGPLAKPAPRPPTLPNGWVPLEVWAGTNGWSKPRLLDSTTTLSYALQSTNHSSRFTIGSREARVDDADCWLGFPPKLINGRPHIHALDLEKTLLPLWSRNGELPIRNRVIVLDPGHGGDDPDRKSVV